MSEAEVVALMLKKVPYIKYRGKNLSVGSRANTRTTLTVLYHVITGTQANTMTEILQWIRRYDARTKDSGDKAVD